MAARIGRYRRAARVRWANVLAGALAWTIGSTATGRGAARIGRYPASDA